MLFSRVKKEALAEHEKAIIEYDQVIKAVQKGCGDLYEIRKESAQLIEAVENLVNSIANTPREIRHSVEKIKIQKQIFKKTESFAKEAFESVKKSGINAAAGIGTGVAVASMAPTMAMWVATTFGTASTGTAISALSGAAATKAALAWLGGGTLAAGGGGVAAGQALLALAGPVGWGIAFAATASSAVAIGKKNKDMAERLHKETKEMMVCCSRMKEAEGTIIRLFEKTRQLLDGEIKQYNQAVGSRGKDFLALSTEQHLCLGTLVNNTLALSELLNKTLQNES